MQIVIDIDEEEYERAMKRKDKFPRDLTRFENIITNGIVLPKGHGDLIDRSKIAFDYWSIDNYAFVGKRNIFEMPVVVPADKERVTE